MNNDFQSWYLALLRKQVEEEIQFLVTNGHQAERISNPCMFCVDTQKGYYRCPRMNELKQFASSIAVNISTKRKSKQERQPIGQELTTQHIIHEALNQLSTSDSMETPIFQIK